VVKVLRPVELQPDWRSIEIHRMTGGWCEIRLSGHAAELAVDAGIDELSVSLTHEASMAGAFVVGRCTAREQGEA
jgi:holo-[acyl-carrier protein] synthase